ncbi:hypothetical protein [Dietzia lutea]|uniref:Uncharacterized protein n=1 Tax=Dietzia lutea TaxID=546160 RepID=A0A2S1RD16_9ACTN|nr:hypothetical protein [Dietzia lutea]AWH94152.1 hypothetical protein A6035_17605 [Dietzia lutea]
MRVHDDGDWSTIIVFEGLLTVTNALITWDIPPGTPAGEYRVVYTASGRGLDGPPVPGSGGEPGLRRALTATLGH